jgi:hypothetical protein
LEKCKQYRLVVEFSKYEFYKQELRFLGYIVRREYIKTDKDCIKAITEWSIPKSIKEVEIFLVF